MVSAGEKSVFVPGLLELMGYGRISGTGMKPYPHRVRRNAPSPLPGLYCRVCRDSGDLRIGDGTLSSPCATEMPLIDGPLDAYDGAVELEPISDIMPTALDPSPCGARSTRKRLFPPPWLVEGLEIWDDLWTGDETLSSRGGAGAHTSHT